MQVLVINLDEDVDRLEKINRQIPYFTKIKAVKGSEIDRNDLYRYTTNFCRYFCTDAMIGCFLSHIKCWRYIVDNNLDKALVLEDDVELVDNFFDKIDELVSFVPNDDWDIILCGCIFCNQDNDKISKLIMFFQNIFSYPVTFNDDIDVNEHLYKPKIWTGSHAMIISLKGAKLLLQKLDKASYHVDIKMSKLNLNVYSSKKNLANQKSIMQIL